MARGGATAHREGSHGVSESHSSRQGASYSDRSQAPSGKTGFPLIRRRVGMSDLNRLFSTALNV